MRHLALTLLPLVAAGCAAIGTPTPGPRADAACLTHAERHGRAASGPMAAMHEHMHGSMHAGRHGGAAPADGTHGGAAEPASTASAAEHEHGQAAQAAPAGGRCARP